MSAPCLFPLSSPDGSFKLGRSYDLQERRRTGNMTGTALYQHMPTDESEAKTLATVDLDGIKSEYVCVCLCKTSYASIPILHQKFSLV